MIRLKMKYFLLKKIMELFNNQRIRVSNKNNINDCLFAIGEKNINKLNLTNRKSGCAALDMAYVASGRYDGYYQKNLNIWDIAAGIILIKRLVVL